MKKKLVLASFGVLVFWSNLGLAQTTSESSLSKTNSCVIVYVKNDNSQPNLTIACDGDLVLKHTVKTEKQLQDANAFKADLFSAFQTMVNSEHQKKCDQYDLDGVWWASCIQ